MKNTTIKQKIYQTLFESSTKTGIVFDILLIIHILISVSIMMLDSIDAIHESISSIVHTIEWYITIVFTLEYFLRIYSTKHRKEYLFSFFGVIDFLCLLPTYLGILIGSTHYLLVIRLLRVLRIFRILRLIRFMSEAQQLLVALKMSGRKVVIFFVAEIILTTVFGSIMYVIEGEANGFTSIPRSIYWAIVTMTTVGYGDISPQTNLGQGIAMFAMIIAYSIMVISTGMITLSTTNNYKELSTHTESETSDNQITTHCPKCNVSLTPIQELDEIHYCYKCGTKLPKGTN